MSLREQMMRWLFLLLLVLNVFYYIWHQQQVPLLGKEIAPLGLHKSERENIRLLNETPQGDALRHQ